MPDSKRDMTRQRLIDAANARFRATGYEHATAAMIAEDAGVTERTFFRYFPTKSAVLIANWEEHREALRDVLRSSPKRRVADVVRDALVAFADRLQAEVDSGIDSVVQLFTDHAAFIAMSQTLLEIETDIAIRIGRRTGRSMDDVDVRVAANASFGVFRASVRAYIGSPESPGISELITTRMRHLRGAFAALERPSG
jgi:AcrR family transcriptional regulator